MSGWSMVCQTCWFRKSTEGSESHLGWHETLKEGDCVISKRQCDHEWRGYGNIVNCPVLMAFYDSMDKPKPKPKPKPKAEERKDHEQLYLF